MKIGWRLAVACAVACLAVPTTAQTGADLRARVAAWVRAQQPALVNELVELLSIPNVAADRPNIRRNARHLEQMLARRGFAAELLETDGNPLVYGELRVPGATRTILFYSHYDGQPVDPKSWKQDDPFKPVLRTNRLDRGGEIIDMSRLGTAPGGAARGSERNHRAVYEDDWRLYARSASDDKSPIAGLCAAIDSLESLGLMPAVNVRVILDGEEEASSPSLVPAIARHRAKLAADLMVILDGPIHSSGRPTIAYGARGIVTFDLTVFGPKAGVHSGNYGNWIPNPAQRLAALLASMKDDSGRVLVQGFYDALVPLTAEEQAMLEAVPEDTRSMLRTFGVAEPEAAFPMLQAGLQAPTLNVRGLSSAHVGAGARTIIPDRATAAMDIRLVKETSAEDLVEKVRAHVRAQGYHLAAGEPSDEDRARHPRMASLVVFENVMAPFRTRPLDAQARRVATALEQAFGDAPVQLRTLGGSVPIAPFIEALGFPAILVPVVNFDNNQHEENENLRLGSFFQGIEIIAAILRS